MYASLLIGGTGLVSVREKEQSETLKMIQRNHLIKARKRLGAADIGRKAKEVAHNTWAISDGEAWSVYGDTPCRYGSHPSGEIHSTSMGRGSVPSMTLNEVLDLVQHGQKLGHICARISGRIRMSNILTRLERKGLI